MTHNSYDPNSSSDLSKNNKGEIQNSSNPAIRLVVEIVGLQESLKTIITNQRIESRIISANFKAWDEYDRSQR
ncbi:MAG TPA: hypothetical protein DDZ60_08885 [Planktothrix sp. UBA10369]|jgi:hypothetical protein|nr:hypothetical protein [Microcoleaceae cyanobacterium UBA11344]HBK22601.1 hypothetical protein [Planktothrix sp. UBA10369]